MFHLKYHYLLKYINTFKYKQVNDINFSILEYVYNT